MCGIRTVQWEEEPKGQKLDRHAGTGRLVAVRDSLVLHVEVGASYEVGSCLHTYALCSQGG